MDKWIDRWVGAELRLVSISSVFYGQAAGRSFSK